MSRILMTLRPDRGGVFAHVARLCEALSERGHEVIVCGPLADRVAELRARVIPIEIERRVRPGGDLRAALRLARVIRELDPDLIHAHGSKGPAIARIARLASPSVPLVFTPHLFAFDNYLESPVGRACYRGVELALAPLASRVIAVCKREAELAAQVGSRSRVRVVHNGLDPLPPAEPHPGIAALGSNGPIIGTVAELRGSKGVVTLLDAFATVRERDPGAKLVVAGDGPERSRIEARAAELALGGSLRLLGSVPSAAPVLAGVDVFVNPAYAEAFPYTVLEAMAAEVPIVATDVGGTREAIEHRNSGLLVPPRQPAPLAAAILELVGDRKKAARLAANAAHRYRNRFTAEQMVSGVLRVYEELGIATAPRLERPPAVWQPVPPAGARDQDADAPNPTVSVIISAYNAEATLDATLASVRAQTLADHEVVVVDDGSTDGTAQIAEHHRGSMRLTVLSQPNRGNAAARNAGLEVARGRYVAVLDSDDLWLPLYLESMVAALEARPDAGFAFTDAWLLDDRTGRVRRTSAMHGLGPVPLPDDPRPILERLLDQNFVYGSVTARRDALTQVGGFRPQLRVVEDYEMWLRLLAGGFAAVRVPGRLAVYRDRSGSLSKDDLAMLRSRRELMRLAEEEYGLDPELRRQAAERRRRYQRQIQRVNGLGLGHAGLEARQALGTLKRRLRRPSPWRSAPSEVAAQLSLADNGL